MATSSFVLLPVSRSSSSARGALRAVLGTWADEETRADAALLLGELVANGVREAHSSMAVRLRMDQDVLRAEVRDGSPGTPVPRDPDEHGGRGVLILNALATHWGVQGHAGVGKTVWFELAGAGARSPVAVPA